MNLSSFVIDNSSSIKNALEAIELNQMGFILVEDQSQRIEGIATDGDIRRILLKNCSINDSISICINKNFIKASTDTPRELLLKQLDNKIKFIPVLDNKLKLITIISRDFIPQKDEQKVFARSKSPVRISFGGGGSDISAYFSENKAAVINSTISLYSHSTLKIRDDSKIILYS
jgi:D-glycero-alpha-D-manno-heptose-7-phosphate kinase